MKNQNLVAAREKMGKTQKQVAKEIGIAESAYRRYELGNATPNAIMGNKIARKLETTSEHLWGYGVTEGL